MNPRRGRDAPGGWVRVCLPAVLLTYRMGDDFLVFCGENGSRGMLKVGRGI